VPSSKRRIPARKPFASSSWPLPRPAQRRDIAAALSRGLVLLGRPERKTGCLSESRTSEQLRRSKGAPFPKSATSPESYSCRPQRESTWTRAWAVGRAPLPRSISGEGRPTRPTVPPPGGVQPRSLFPNIATTSCNSLV
jgi:hypothetical protein